MPNPRRKTWSVPKVRVVSMLQSAPDTCALHPSRSGFFLQTPGLEGGCLQGHALSLQGYALSLQGHALPL